MNEYMQTIISGIIEKTTNIHNQDKTHGSRTVIDMIYDDTFAITTL
jgi:hypothetical protein